ncbi:MAG: hypothetical protein K1X89_02735 [Myxococcaceae bacterium]|nr:hypothetical protein [Myxococcaceae bacterium]
MVASSAGGTAWRLTRRPTGFEATQAETAIDGGLTLRRVTFDQGLSVVQTVARSAPPGLSTAGAPLVLPTAGPGGEFAVVSRADAGFTVRLIPADGGDGPVPAAFDGFPIQAEAHRSGLWLITLSPDGGALLSLDAELREIARRPLPVAGGLQGPRLLPLDDSHVGICGAQTLELLDTSLTQVQRWPLPEGATALSALSGQVTSPTMAWIGPESSLLVGSPDRPRAFRLSSATAITGLLAAPGLTAVVAQVSDGPASGPFLALADGQDRKRGPDLGLTRTGEGSFFAAAGLSIGDGGLSVLGAGLRDLTRLEVVCE